MLFSISIYYFKLLLVCIYFKTRNLLDIITYENINIWSGNKKHCVFILHWPSVLVYVTTWFTTSINIWGIIMNKSTPILWRHAYQHGIYKFQSELKMKVVTRFALTKVMVEKNSWLYIYFVSKLCKCIVANVIGHFIPHHVHF